MFTLLAFRTPISGTAVRIVRVEDRRRFKVTPDDFKAPFVLAQDDLDSGITSRLIGSFRPGADWLVSLSTLPEYTSVEKLIRQILTQAFRNAGFRVTTKPDGGAIPVEVRIEEFLTFSSGGGYNITHSLEVQLLLEGALSGHFDTINLEHSSQLNSSSFGMGSFGPGVSGVIRNVVSRGLADFGNDIATRLREIRENTRAIDGLSPGDPKGIDAPIDPFAESLRSLKQLRDQGSSSITNHT